QEPKKKSVLKENVIDLSNGGVGFEDAMDEVIEQEDYDSDEEADALMKEANKKIEPEAPGEGGAGGGGDEA
ncbi:MAG: hypothetical protein AAF587_44970, partial [Bacteroidota bacterium]